MNLPSFAEFKRNQSSYYAFVTILALIFIFSLYKSSQEKQLDQCNDEKKTLQIKVDLLQEKLLTIVQKQTIKDSIKRKR